MPAKITHLGGFFKSSLFSTIILLNFIISICFMVMIAYEGFHNVQNPKTEAIEQNPLPQSVSANTALLSEE